MNLESWRELSFNNGQYSVSNFGKVRNNLNGYIFKGQDNGRGYLRAQFFCLGMKNKYIHRLVAEFFVDNPNEYKEVNHIDGNKHNNHYTNLEWCSRSQNLIHASRNDLKNPKVPEVNRIRIIDEFNSGVHINDLVDRYKTCRNNIYRIVRNDRTKRQSAAKL